MATTQAVRPARRLRQLMARKEILVAPGVFSALSARLIQRVGFDAAYMSGAGTVTAMTALPDIGLLSVTEMALNARYITSAVGIPVIADADTGYGNALNVLRTVREYEQAGLAGLHIEDQVAPKRCGHLAGKECISTEEMAGKVRAAVSARSDPDFVVIARVDARAPLGFDEAVRRGRAYLEAGADVIFPEALESREEFRDYARAVKAPLLANMAEFGKTPYLTAREFEELGYRIVIFATSGLRVALRAMESFFDDLKRTGTQTAWLERMMTRTEVYDLIDYPRYTELEREFIGDARDPLV